MAEYFLKIEKPGFEKFFVGVFEAETQAQEIIDQAIAGESSIYQDAKMDVLTKTKARKEGLSSPVYGDKSNNLFESLPLELSALSGKSPNGNNKSSRETEEDEPEVEQPERKRGRPKGTTKKDKEVTQSVMQPRAMRIQGSEEIIYAYPEDRVYIVGQSQEVNVWLYNKGWHGEPLKFILPEQASGSILIGVVPYHIAALAKAVGILYMPGIRPDQKGKLMSPDELDSSKAEIQWYVPPRRTKLVIKE